VHRDVKPSNILLDGEGQPYLTDFDLVTAPDTTGGTRTGAMGTFLYAPPEMLERPQEADARADVYGLGMTMAFMLHGEPLPHASVRDASSFVKSLALAAPYRLVLGRAVAWKPEHRLADAGEFCQALRTAPQVMSSLESACVYTLSDLLHDTRSNIIDQCPIFVSFREFCLDSGSGTLRTRSHEWDGLWDKFLNGHATAEVFLLKSRNPAPSRLHPVTIGRGNRCDVRIPYGSVSRMHALVLFESDSCSWCILDNESHNGTYVNDLAIAPGGRVRLRPGDLVALGTSAFWFVDPATLNELATLVAFAL
jgi:serine/threonine protein kinase